MPEWGEYTLEQVFGQSTSRACCAYQTLRGFDGHAMSCSLGIANLSRINRQSGSRRCRRLRHANFGSLVKGASASSRNLLFGKAEELPTHLQELSQRLRFRRLEVVYERARNRHVLFQTQSPHQPLVAHSLTAETRSLAPRGRFAAERRKRLALARRREIKGNKE